jgi:hypothetical protein
MLLFYIAYITKPKGFIAKGKEVKMTSKDYDWIIEILRKVTVTREQFMKIIEQNTSNEKVDEEMKGKIADIERDNLIESLLK